MLPNEKCKTETLEKLTPDVWRHFHRLLISIDS